MPWLPGQLGHIGPRWLPLWRPRDVATKVGVRQQLGNWLVARYRNECDLKTSAPGILHGGNAIGVVGSKSDQIDRPICGQIGHIDAYAHVYAFLLEFRVEVGVGQRLPWRVGYLVIVNDVASEFEDAQADAEQVLIRESLEPSITSGEGLLVARDRQDCSAVKRRAIVVHDAMDRFACDGASEAYFLDVIGVVLLAGTLGMDTNMSAIQHDCDFG